MTFNVYLNEEKTRLHPAFREEQKKDKGQEWKEPHLGPDYIFSQKQKWYLMFSPESFPLPPSVAELVVEVTLHDQFTADVYRERGVYRRNSATAELDTSHDSEKPTYRLCLRGNTHADVRNLYQLIRAGSIRPEESWESPQTGRSARELVAELEEALAALSVAEERLARVRALADRRWPLCLKASIRNILGN